MLAINNVTGKSKIKFIKFLDITLLLESMQQQERARNVFLYNESCAVFQ